MDYTHSTLGLFNAQLANNLAASADITPDQIKNTLNQIKISQVVVFVRADNNLDIKRATYRNFNAKVMLNPGAEMVVFDGYSVTDGEPLSRYALDYLRAELEDDLIYFARKHLEELRADAKYRFLGLAKAKLINIQDNTRQGLDYITSLMGTPKMGAIEHTSRQIPVHA